MEVTLNQKHWCAKSQQHPKRWILQFGINQQKVDNKEISREELMQFLPKDIIERLWWKLQINTNGYYTRYKGTSIQTVQNQMYLKVT